MFYTKKQHFLRINMIIMNNTAKCIFVPVFYLCTKVFNCDILNKECFVSFLVLSPVALIVRS